MIPVSGLIALFRRMYQEHWVYEWGAAREGCVDCSGAFVWAYKQFGASIYHGSNSIARKYCGAMGKEPHPGYAAFKWRAKDTAKYPDGKGDFYHIGLVAEDGAHVYEARGTKAGFVKSEAGAWHSFAPLKDVQYDEGGQTMEPYHAVVSTSSGSLNMRSGPGLSYPVTFKLPKGTPVTVLIAYDTGWAFVDEDGTQGYVSLKYLTRVNDTESAQDAPDAPAGEIPAPQICTRLRRADGVEIDLAGSWEVVTKPPDERGD